MNLALSADQAAIAAAAEHFLSRTLSTQRIRELASQGGQPMPDDRTWKTCAAQGWLGLAVPESFGGSGLGLPEEAILMREIGRHVAPGPYLSSMVAATMAVRAEESRLAEDIVAGERRVGLGVGDLAIDAGAGDLVLRLGDGGATVWEVQQADPVAAVDPTSRCARILSGRKVLEATDANLMARARVLAAAELLGIVEAVRDMSAEYARTRQQFGRPIGTFQAVKHRCADMAIGAYACTGQVLAASLYVEGDVTDAAFHAASAYVLALRVAQKSTEDNVLNHGGMGFTWGHDAHLYLKRAFLLGRILGPVRASYEAILRPPRHEFS